MSERTEPTKHTPNNTYDLSVWELIHDYVYEESDECDTSGQTWQGGDDALS